MERRFDGYGNSGGFRPQSNFAPVKVGDELEVTIDAVGGKGDGLAKKDGFVLFVPNTKEGDHVKIRVTKVLRKVGFAEVAGQSSGESQSGEAQTEETESKENEAETDSEEENSSEEDQ